MSGLLALLDDVAAIAKVAAASVDDVISQAAKAGAKAAGAVIDDAAVSPKYVQGFAPARELPIVGRIALGSIKNKLLYLLPAGLALSAFAPWAIAPLLMVGGCYLCFEGAEKVAHIVMPGKGHDKHGQDMTEDMAHLEETKVVGAIKTDFILSAEIMTITLAAIPQSNFWIEAATLAVVAVMITAVVYGSVALIVKADDIGLHMSTEARLPVLRAIGRSVVRGMPGFLVALTMIGTAAMLWVGGSILVHGLEELGFPALGDTIHYLAVIIAHWGPVTFEGITEWFATAAMYGIIGVAIGLALIPVVTKVLVPAWHSVRG
jgi:predicted DNA repair protein MutK